MMLAVEDGLSFPRRLRGKAEFTFTAVMNQEFRLSSKHNKALKSFASLTRTALRAAA